MKKIFLRFKILTFIEIVLFILSIFISNDFTIWKIRVNSYSLTNLSNALLFIIVFELITLIINDKESRKELKELIINSTQQLSPDLDLLAYRDYTKTIKSIIDKSKKDIYIILRTGKILEDCEEQLARAINRGCNIKVFFLDKDYFLKNPSLLKNIIQEGNSSRSVIEFKFDSGYDTGRELLKKSSSLENNLDIQISRNYVTSQLIVLSNSSETDGYFFYVPLFYNLDPRDSPNYLISKKDNKKNRKKAFIQYKKAIEELWSDTEVEKVFDNSLTKENITVRINKICELEKNNIKSSITDLEQEKIYKIFRKYGVVLLKPHTPYFDFSKELEVMKEYFGNDSEPKHDCSENGVSTIKPEEGYEEHFSKSKSETGLHTDGSYSHNPPKIVVHQCISSAQEGGRTQLVSCKNILSKLKEESREIFDFLKCDREVFYIGRGEHGRWQHIFCDCQHTGRIEVIFRSKGPAIIKPSKNSKINEAFHKFDKFAHDHKNIVSFRLEPHDILIIDNTSVLHGRDEFQDDNRELKRLWLDGKSHKKDIDLYLGFDPDI